MIAQLRQEQMEKIKIVGEAEVESSAYGQVVLGAGAVAGLDEQLALEAAKAGPSIWSLSTAQWERSYMWLEGKSTYARILCHKKLMFSQ